MDMSPAPIPPRAARSGAVPAPRGRLRGLDALRGLAALSVCLFHYTYSFPHETGRDLAVSAALPYGDQGVDLFFIISGFVIFMTLENSRTAYDFAAARVARLYPAFLAALLLTTAVLLGLSDFPELKPGAGQFLANLTMLPQVFGTVGVDGVYWTLAYEAGFYLFAATVIWRCGLDRVELVCIAWLAATLMLRFSPFVIWHYPYLLHMIRLATAGSYAMLFITGIMLYRICAGRARLATYFVLGACLLAAFAGPLHFVLPMSGLDYFLVIGSFALLVWLAGTGRLPLRLLWPLVFLGDISYSFYLLHQYIGWVAIDRLQAHGVGADAAVLITLAGTVALAAAVNRLVERPGQRLVRAFFARYRNRLAGGAAPAYRGARISRSLIGRGSR